MIKHGLGIAVAMVLGGCGSTVEPPRASRPAPAGFAQTWVDRGLRPIGQLTAVGSTMVGVVVDRYQLYVVAIDPATGNLRWRHEMSASWITPGVELAVTRIDDGHIAYLQPGRRMGNDAKLVIADAATGRALATSPTAIFSSPPYACGQDACALARTGRGTTATAAIVRLGVGAYREEAELPRGARFLETPSLFDVGDRPGNTLAWMHDGAIQWRVPVSAAFPPEFSSDYGWAWHEFADAHVIAGSVYSPPAPRTPDGQQRTEIAQTAATAGLVKDTGEVLWRDSGSSFECHLGSLSYPVRCRRSGVATRMDEGPISYEGLDMTMEGFEPTTGKVTWSVPLGPAHGLIEYETPRLVAGASKVVLSGLNGPIVLDYATGQVTTPVAGAVFWCMTRPDYDSYPSYGDADGKPHYRRASGELAASCDAQGRPSQALPGVEATLAAGAQVGGYVVLAGRDGYTGFHTP